MKNKISLLLLIISFTALTSCIRQISPNAYTTRQVGEMSFTYSGIVRNIRAVYVNSGDELENNDAGITGGAIAGGLFGNAIGRGDLLPTAAGAFAGAITGSLIERQIKQQVAFEYVVEMGDGGLITLVQGAENCLSIGQPVYVITSTNGRSRIIPQ